MGQSGVRDSEALRLSGANQKEAEACVGLTIQSVLTWPDRVSLYLSNGVQLNIDLTTSDRLLRAWRIT
jgi:hypothetical protein